MTAITPRVVPYSVEHTEAEGSTETHDINIRKFGDCYDPTAPMRVRDVTAEWQMDTDSDGEKN